MIHFKGVFCLLNLRKIQEILSAEVLIGAELMETEIHSACGADLMSDVLAFTKENTLLLTGMVNCQVIRTAEISDLSAIIFVRGKVPREEVLEAARVIKIPILITKYPMYEACGKLFAAGLAGCSRKEDSII